MPRNEVERRTMWISVWHSDMFGRNDFLGEVMMPMSGQVFDDPSAKWFSLQDRVGFMFSLLWLSCLYKVLSLDWAPRGWVCCQQQGWFNSRSQVCAIRRISQVQQEKKRNFDGEDYGGKESSNSPRYRTARSLLQMVRNWEETLDCANSKETQSLC